MTKEMADDVEYHEEFVTNPRGLRLFTCGWLPASSSPKALIFLCHGYGMEVSGFMKGWPSLAATAAAVMNGYGWQPQSIREHDAVF
uniref:Serine aminopeptidase S33 domain-containing protein n=1 Tax=Oryza nivara TaxID=4536 RepID=A0A0E0GZ61_ORYNI